MSYEIETRDVRYSVGDTELTGFLASPRATTKPRPAVLIVHEWWGHNDYVRKRAQQLAAVGYPAFALDMYGTGKVASHPQDAQAFMQEVMGNKDTMEQRFRAAYDVLRNTTGVDPKRIAAIGYCMGGGIVLRMARTTDLLTAAASFHGSLGAAVDLDNANGHTKRIFIAQGGADPFVPEDVFDKLKTQIRGNTEGLVAATYDGAKHGFTNPDATAKGKEFGLPLAYDAKADASSWTTLMEVLHDAFGDGLRLIDSR
ncbi:MAG: dienelactone hydrolase family protein [Planctomycetes bacterium]|nr:dienelactone hydrolase family protein [Planctomycetota bacterium]